ncbi:MAG TPA: DPP IV N-terminal domain-containing protein, partial [Candidatus Polarisedimenticolaceae bacterium]|nr:DPP IV N-terminal domain-containing protein [Candidatus Polarisedimenticolaceae bacterium]
MDTARKTGGWLLSAVLLLGVLPHVAAGDAGEDLLDLYAETYRFRLGRPEVVRVTPDAAAVLFLRSGPRDPTRALFELDLASGRERTLATASDLLGGEAETLSAEEQARRERQRVSARGIASYELSPDGRSVLVPLSGRLFLVDRADGSVRELAGSPVPAIDARFSPDGSTVSCVRDGEIYLIGLADGVERPLTRGAGGGVTHGLAEFVAQEEMG